MSLMQILVFIAVGALAGWIAGVVVRGGGQGIVLNVVVGILGAFLGGWVFNTLGIVVTGGLGELFLMATVGAVILLAVLRLIARA